MKKITGVLVVLALLILGGFYWMGMITENTIRKNVDTVNQSNGLTAELVSYKRGFFTSEANIKWNLHVPERELKNENGQAQTAAAQDFQFDLPLKIFHGPIIFTGSQLKFGMGYAQSVIQLPSPIADQFNAMFSKESTKPQVDMSIFINYLNRSTINLSVPTFKLMDKEGKGQMEWMGLNFSTSISDKAQKVDGDILLKGMEFTKEDVRMVLKQATADYNLHQTSAGLLLGDANASLPSFVITKKDEKIFEINELSLQSVSDVSNDLFSTTMDLSVKSMFANAQSYGPGNLKLALSNLDANVLAKLNDKANEMQNGSELQRQQALLGLLPELPKLLSKGPKLELSQLSLKLPQGIVEGHFVISLPKTDNANPFELMQKLEGEAKFQVSAGVLKQMLQQSLMQQLASQPLLKMELMKLNQTQGQPELTVEQLAAMHADKQIATMQQTGLIKAMDSDFVLEMNLNQGKFTVNGKPFDPSMTKF